LLAVVDLESYPRLLFFKHALQVKASMQSDKCITSDECSVCRIEHE